MVRLRFMDVSDRYGGEIAVSWCRDLSPAAEVPEVWPAAVGWGVLSLLVPLFADGVGNGGIGGGIGN